MDDRADVRDDIVAVRDVARAAIDGVGRYHAVLRRAQATAASDSKPVRWRSLTDLLDKGRE